MRTEQIIQAEGLVKHYGTVAALDGFNLSVPAGEIHGLLGPNGAGKSTAVGVLATLIAPDAGNAHIMGYDTATQADAVRRQIGLVGQAHAVDTILSGKQNLEMFGQLYGLKSEAAKKRSGELLERFGLDDTGNKGVAQYSGGMRRRLDIAVALILDPAVLFLDEPTTGLDPRARNDVWQAIVEIANRGTAVLLTTQYLDEADKLAGNISVMKQGQVIANGSPKQLKESIGGDRIVVIPADAGQAEQLAQVLSRCLDVEARIDEESGSVSAAAASGTTSLSRALRGIDESGIVLDDVELRQPTLDDVFLTLTAEPAIPTDSTGDAE